MDMRNLSRSRPLTITITFLVLVVVSCIFVAPFVWMVSTSVKPVGEVMTRQVEWLPRHVTFDNYAKVLEKPVLRWLFNSLVVSTLSTGVSLLTGAMAGYALARMHFPVAGEPERESRSAALRGAVGQ